MTDEGRLGRAAQEIAHLREENTRWRKSLDFVPSIIVTIDLLGTITHANRQACELFGYRLHECVGKNWYDCFFSQETRDRVKFYIRKLVNGDLEELRYFETPMLTRLRIPKVIAWRSLILKDADGRPTGVFNTGEDLTEKKALEREVQQSELQYKAMLEVLPDAIHVIDRECRITYWNPAFQKFAQPFGISSEVVGKRVFEVFPFLDSRVESEYQQVFRNAEVLITQEENILQGRIVTTETRKVPIVRDNAVQAIITIIREIPYVTQR